MSLETQANPNRNTRQRQVIQAAFLREARPLTVPEVLTLAQNELPGLGQATVYRTVKRLLEEEWLVSLELPGSLPHYERQPEHHHHHFQCRVCRRVYELDTCDADLAGMVPPGFVLEDHEIILKGCCAACSLKVPGPRPC